MRQLRWLTLLFCAAVSIPLGYLLMQTRDRMEQEEVAQLRFFAETIFNEMEREMAALVLTEERRPVDAYNHYITPEGADPDATATARSPLSYPPEAPYILGYFQNNPDGGFQTPLTPAAGTAPDGIAARVGELARINAAFNGRRSAAAPPPPRSEPGMTFQQVEQKAEAGFAERFLSRKSAPRDYLGQKEKRVEEITVNQALNLARSESEAPAEMGAMEDLPAPPKTDADGWAMADKKGRKDADGRMRAQAPARLGREEAMPAAAPSPDAAAPSLDPSASSRDTSAPSRDTSTFSRDTSASSRDTSASSRDTSASSRHTSASSRDTSAFSREASTPLALAPASDGRLQAEVDPLQTVRIDADRYFIYRRIMIGNRIYRQGLALRREAFLRHLAETHFATQPMAAFTSLRLATADDGFGGDELAAGALIKKPRYVLARAFPRPFSFIRANLICDKIPPSAGRRTLWVMTGALALVLLMGLGAIYQSARAAVELSTRRSQFVSSVTHELKTPLTSIRMYIEMLEMGMARTPEQEANYYRILDSETARLSRLISNVLEYAKLERRQFRLDLKQGDFTEVIEEARRIMSAKLAAEGFELAVDHPAPVSFLYDREVMIQVLINLMENSIKFCRDSAARRIAVSVLTEGKWVMIRVSDTGPGMPPRALKKVFDDFYRAENAVTRATRGTGIGLAFVKKVIVLSGGRVSARNNEGPGCAITLRLPTRHRSSSG